MLFYFVDLLWRVIAIYVFVKATNELVQWHYFQFVHLCQLTTGKEFMWKTRVFYLVISSPRIMAYLLILISVSYSLGVLLIQTG